MKIPESDISGKEGGVPRLIVNNQCCLEDAPSSVVAAIKKQLTIRNPKYDSAVKYGRWIGKKLKPKLYFFHTSGKGLFFPRGFANRAVMLSRSLAGVSPEIIDNRRLVDEIDLGFSGTLRPYQQEAVEAVVKRSFGVLEAGTGSGKTVMALSVIARRRQPTLIVVHSRELLHQWRRRIEEFLGMEAGQAGGGRVDIRPVTVGIVNTVRKRLDELTPRFGQLVVDECHRVPSSLFTDVVSAFDSWYMLGLSATAFRREDGMTDLIYTSLGDRVYSVAPEELVESGAIVRPEFIQYPTRFEHGFFGEYAKLIKALAEDEPRNRQITGDIATLLDKGHSGTVLVVSDRVAHCRNLQEKLRRQGYEAVLLTGRVHPEERERIVENVQSGTIQVLIATLQLIGEGFDCPGLSTIVLATPIKFEGRLLQVVGRVMRPARGKKARVLDYIDVNVPVLRRSALARQEIFNQW